MAETESGQWTWNFCKDDIWVNELYETKQDAIEAGRTSARDAEKQLFFVGQIETISLPTIGVSSLLDDLGCQIYDEVGEVAEGYLLYVKQEHQDELEDALNLVFTEWAIKYGYTPNFYEIVNIEQITI